MLKAILFDLDGTLVDTEQIGVKIAEYILRNVHIDLTVEEKKIFIGINDTDFYSVIGKHHRMNSKEIEDITQIHTMLYRSWLAAGVPLFTGVKNMLNFCTSNKIKMAIVTGSLQSETKMILEQHNLSSYFSAIITADHVSAGKPNPEGYLKALHHLQCTKDESIVVEDSLHGIRAANTAQLRTIAISRSEKIPLADFHCTSLTEVTLLLNKWIRTKTSHVMM